MNDAWYFSAEGREHGPLGLEQARDFVREHPGAYCWRQGFGDWRPAFECPEIRRMKKDGVTPFPPPPPEMMEAKPGQLPSAAGSAATAPPVAAAPAPAVAGPASQGFGLQAHTAGIDFKVYGHEMQYVEVELDHGESAVAEAGAMMYKTAGVAMQTIFGDGSESSGQGMMDRLLGAGRRLLTNESLFTTVFTQECPGKGRVAFAAPFPGTILPLQLSDYGGKLVCQKDSFLAGAKGVQIGIQFQRRILTGLFGGEGFILQKLEGDGLVFVHMGGSIHCLDLAPGETLHVDTGCLAAMTATVDYDVEQAGGVKTMLFGGEGLFFVRLTGPGKVWLQSLPFSRLAGRMLAASSSWSRHQEEGSVLGGLGGLLGGDRF